MTSTDPRAVPTPTDLRDAVRRRLEATTVDALAKELSVAPATVGRLAAGSSVRGTTLARVAPLLAAEEPAAGE